MPYLFLVLSSVAVLLGVRSALACIQVWSGAVRNGYDTDTILFGTRDALIPIYFASAVLFFGTFLLLK